MIMNKKLTIDKIDAFIFDFDGVLTNNLVQTDESGKETVICSRADGLAFDLLNKIKKPVFIISTEKNPVVEARARKLSVPVLQSVANKTLALKKLAKLNGYNLKNIFYVGNDLNDYYAMESCGFSACPIDSHIKIKEISNIILKTRGGEGVVRELLENVFDLDFIKILY
jgi:3-deoxy-D-manno-octulosonate 8-phosphate phosphatase (KDO 8-P phosphatase)